MTFLLINGAALLLIVFVIYWFWLHKVNDKTNNIPDLIEVSVKDGIYQPATIFASIGKSLTLRFIRLDSTPCSEVVIFHQLDISKQLLLNQPMDVLITLSIAGEYDFTCHMGMYRGKLIVQ